MASATNKAAIFLGVSPFKSTPTPSSRTNTPISFMPMSSKPLKDMPISLTLSLSSLKGRTCYLERPASCKPQLEPIPETQQGGSGDIRWRKKTALGNGESYKVLLIDDELHTEEKVEEVLPRAVPSITRSDARKLFHESRKNGSAVVIVTVKEYAECYAESMEHFKLKSAIVPDSDSRT